MVIYLGWLLPKKYCMLGISGLLFSKIALKQSRNTYHVKNFTSKKFTYPTSLHPIVAVGPFAKWGIHFVHCRPTSARGHGYIIVVVDYFTKWVEEMPTYVEDGRTVALFLFNHIIARFRIPRAIVTDHGSRF